MMNAELISNAETNVNWQNLSNREVFRLALAGDIRAQYEVGFCLALDPHTRPTGLAWLKKASECGHEGASEVLRAFVPELSCEPQSLPRTTRTANLSQLKCLWVLGVLSDSPASDE